jgi:hypothetical protein
MKAIAFRERGEKRCRTGILFNLGAQASCLQTILYTPVQAGSLRSQGLDRVRDDGLRLNRKVASACAHMGDLCCVAIIPCWYEFVQIPICVQLHGEPRTAPISQFAQILCRKGIGL